MGNMPKAFGGMTALIMTQRLEHIIELVLTHELEDHFIDPDLMEEFEYANVPKDERAEIRRLLDEARAMTANANTIPEPIRRRIILRITKAETELFKEAVGFGAFLAAASEVAELVEKFGEKTKPIAESIALARTKTERHLKGNLAIEKEPQPKQLEAPKK